MALFSLFHWPCCILWFNFIGTYVQVKVFLVANAPHKLRKTTEDQWDLTVLTGLSSTVTWPQPYWTFTGALEDWESQVFCDKLCWDREPQYVVRTYMCRSWHNSDGIKDLFVPPHWPQYFSGLTLCSCTINIFLFLFLNPETPGASAGPWQRGGTRAAGSDPIQAAGQAQNRASHQGWGQELPHGPQIHGGHWHRDGG